jgi:hypothetical protein
MSTGVQRESAEPDNSTVTAKVNCWDQMREPLGELTASRSHDHDRFAVTLDHDRFAATHKIRLLCVDKTCYRKRPLDRASAGYPRDAHR